MDVYDIGDLIKLTATFKNSGGTPTDPTTITLRVTDPVATTSVYTYALAQVTKESAGVYSKSITPASSGYWHYRWEGTGAVEQVEQGLFFIKVSSATLVAGAITPAILKEHVETDLSDAGLQKLIDDAVAEINNRFGADGAAVTEEYFMGEETEQVGRRRLFLKRPIGTLTSVKEGPTLVAADLTTLVENTDFFQMMRGKALEKIGGDWQKWVQVIHTPASDQARRHRVIIDLCKLALQYNALSAEGVGDWRGSHVDYQAEREKLLTGLASGGRIYA